MKPCANSILLLALGNDIMGDDAVGLRAARLLEKEFTHEVDFCETTEAGLSLLDIMSGYDRVLLLDSIVTGKHSAGTVLEFYRADFDKVTGPSPHYAGLPEVLALAERLDIAFPRNIRVLALEIATPNDFGQTLSPAIDHALPDFVERAGRILRQWKDHDARDLAHSESAGNGHPADQSP